MQSLKDKIIEILKKNQLPHIDGSFWVSAVSIDRYESVAKAIAELLEKEKEDE